MKNLFVLLLLSMTFAAQTAEHRKLEDYLDRKEIQKKIRETIADQDVNFNVDLGSIDLIDGINLSNEYRYGVEASYINKYYTRIDKWDLKAAVNVGEVVKDLVDIPFSFSINKSSSFFFVRQFPKKLDAMKAIPYAPNKLPLNAKLALKNLSPGDFVSMPANLSVAVSAGFSSAYISPIIVNANTSSAFVMSGEFTIQIFKMDESHVRLKLISKRGRDTSGNIGVGASLNVFGIRFIDNQIDRLLDRDLIQLGVGYNPGAQFIIDYVFDLNDKDAQDAYNQIMSSTFKFKDLIVADMVNGSDLKDKLISSYEKADSLYAEDSKLEPKDRRVQRIFKGFSNYKGHTRHIKLAFLVTSYINDRTFTESKVTFIDKNEKNLEFFYPTYSKYIESKLGKSFYELKDQNYQNNFGLIPKFNSEDTITKNPDLGLSFERKDRYFTTNEQKYVERFMIGQIPARIADKIDLSQWRDGVKKYDSRIFFQLILKSQGFEYLKDLTASELRLKIVKYVEDRRKLHVIDNTDPIEQEEKISDPTIEKLKNFLMLNRFIEKERLLSLADSLAKVLNSPNSEDKLRRLVVLNETGIFDKIGVGFLISLLPQEKLEDLIYLKLEMIGKDLKGVSTEFGTLNYHALYKELTEVQSRLSNRSYDLRLSDEDRNMEDLSIDKL